MQRSLTLFILLLSLMVSTIGYAGGHSVTETSGDGYRWIVFIHQLLFVFWLGPDIGIYMWGTKATNPELSIAQRAAAARMMHAIDIIPKVCMSLMLTVGGVLTEFNGITHPWWQMVGIVLLGPIWLVLVLLAGRGDDIAGNSKFAQWEAWLRWLVIVSVVISVIYSNMTDRLDNAPWVSAKLLLFAACVFFGLQVRRRMLPPAQALIAADQNSADAVADTSIQKGIGGARIYMVATWVALAMAAWLGMAQPVGAAIVPH